MNIEKMREDFEAWAITCAWLGLSDECMARDEINGGYYGLELHAAWLAWQASRAALVIELPYVPSYPAHEAASDQDYYLDEAKADIRQQCKQAIEAAGVKWK